MDLNLLIKKAIEEDDIFNDITSLSCIQQNIPCKARFILKEDANILAKD